MAYTTGKRRSIVKKQPRDERGFFIPKIKTSIAHIGASSDENSATDDAIVVKVRNPLHKITQILADIKAHQATKVSLQFTIPLISLPIVLLVAFQLGRAQTACSQIYASKVGTIKTLTVQVPQDEQGPLSFLFSFFPSLPKLETKATFVNEQRTLLLTNPGESLQVIHNPSINTAIFNDQSVILTGNYSACTHAITLDSPQNISPYTQ